MLRAIFLTALFASAGFGLVGCGGGDDGAGTAGDAKATASNGGGDAKATATKSSGGAAAGGSCEVTVTGDLTTSFTGNGGSSAIATSFWFSDKEREEAKKNGLLGDDVFFIMNCGPKDGKMLLSISPAAKTTAKEFKYGPGEYRVAPISFDSSAKPGEFSVLFSPTEASLYSLTEAGTLKITKFDKDGIKATLEFKARESFAPTGKEKQVSVKATFDFKCVGTAC